LYHRYGASAAAVLRSVRDDARLGERLHPELPYLRAEAAYAISHEAALTPDDVLARRLRATITSRDAGAAARDWVRERLSRR
jgi:glycerol-3-phosphate dehydrogenase